MNKKNEYPNPEDKERICRQELFNKVAPVQGDFEAFVKSLENVPANIRNQTHAEAIAITLRINILLKTITENVVLPNDIEQSIETIITRIKQFKAQINQLLKTYEQRNY